MRKLIWLCTLPVSLMVISCGESSTVDVHYDYTAPVSLEVIHSGTYSTAQGANGETVGTMTETYLLVTYGRDGDNQTQTQTLVMDKSKGYHKNSMPLELSYRVPQVTLTAIDNKVLSVRGNEMFVPKVVETLPIKEMFKRQLRDARYQLEFDRYEKQRWELSHLLKGTYQSRANITSVLIQQGRLPIPSTPIDSVVTKGFHSIDGRNCVEYSAYYKAREPFPYFMWEQHAYGTDSGAVYKPFHADSANYDVDYAVDLDPQTGLPCQEREVKRGIFYISQPDTKEQATFKGFVTDENLYTLKND